MTPFVADVKRNYIFGGICPIASNLSIKVCLYSVFCLSSNLYERRRFMLMKIITPS